MCELGVGSERLDRCGSGGLVQHVVEVGGVVCIDRLESEIDIGIAVDISINVSFQQQSID